MTPALRTLAIAGAVALVSGVAAQVAAEPAVDPQITAPPTNYTIVRAKLVKSVRARDEWKARALRAERVLRHEPSVQEAIDLAAFTFGVDPGRMSRIAFCESRYDPRAKNRTSTASGLFQFLDTTWASNRYGRAGFSVWSPLASSFAAAYHMSKYGDRAWECRP